MNLLLQAPSQQQQEEGMALTDINPCEPSLHSLRYHASLLSPNQTNKPNTNNRRTFRRGRRIFSPILLLPLSFVVFFIFLISFIPMTSSFVRFTSIRSSLSQLEQQRQYQHQYQQHRPDLQATLAFHFAASLPSTTSTRRRMAATDATKDDSIQDKLTMTTTTTTKANNHSPLVLIRPLKVAFVTGNTMKSKEINAILADHAAAAAAAMMTANDDNNHHDETTNNNHDNDHPDDHEDNSSSFLYQYVVDLRVVQVDLPEIQEVDTLAIAKHKAQLASQLVGGGPCVIEDTALHFTALGGMPGPYIKWFQESLQSEGLYKILMGYEDKSATAVCTLAFCPSPHADPILFTGHVRGTIVAPVPGRGFGWDSIFVPDQEHVPFSCMTTEQKNAKSHRGKAVRQWAEWMQRNRHELWQRQEQGSQHRPMIGHKGMDFTIYSPEQ